MYCTKLSVFSVETRFENSLYLFKCFPFDTFEKKDQEEIRKKSTMYTFFRYLLSSYLNMHCLERMLRCYNANQNVDIVSWKL